MSVKVFIAPEVKAPKGVVNEVLDWTMTEELHPFWFVKRAQPKTEDKPNMELVFLATQQILACDPKALVEKGGSFKPITEVASVQYPCLVNTVDLAINDELILQWSQVALKAPAKSEKAKNAYDQLLATQSKGKKAKKEVLAAD